MTARATGALLFACAAIAVVAGVLERRASSHLAARAADLAAIDALAGAASTLEDAVLESRAGTLAHFDPIARSVVALREAPRVAARVRAHGRAYREAAEHVDRAAESARADEGPVETFKTDLALLRSSSRYFPVAASALAQRGDAAARAVDAVRTDVERFEVAPAPGLADRLDADLGALDLVAASLDDPAGADVRVVAGHARAILERRERIDRIARTLSRGAVPSELAAARDAYERASRRDLAVAWSARTAVGALLLACLALVTVRRRPTASR